MPRILQITKTLHGGGGVYASRLNDALVDAGWDSTVCSLDDGSLQAGGGVGGRFAPLFDRALSGGIRRVSKTTFHSFLRQTKWDVLPEAGPGDIVHLHSITGFIGSRGLRHLLRGKPRVFWTAHNPWLFTGGCVAYAGCDGFENECKSCPILRHPFKHLAVAEYHSKRRFLEEFAVGVIANSEWMASMMRRSPIFADMAAIPAVPPIVNPEFSPQIGRCDVRRTLGIGDDCFVIGLSASSLTDSGKGIEPFFRTLPTDAEWLSRVTFLLIGDGRVAIPKGVKAVFTGRVSCPVTLAGLYGACDTFASPSFMETFGMAILEAQACGTPVVAFETGGTPEAVSPDTNCRLVPNREFKQIHEWLEARVTSGRPEPSTRMALSLWVQSRHEASVIAKKQGEIYNSPTS